jgi:TP901 family phage tail tape measure protein
MAKSVGKLSVLLTAKNAMRRGLTSARVSLKKFAKKAASIAMGIGKTLGVAIAAGMAIAIKKFLEFDSAMVKSLAIMKNVGDSMRADMRKTARMLSKEVLFSAKELAEGYFFLASAGKSAAQSQRLLGTVAKFAQAGQFDLSTATTLLADAQKTLGLNSKSLIKDQKSLARVGDVLVKANTLANANVQQFSEALTSQSGPAMRAFNIDLEEGVAVLAAYAEQGIKGQEAGTMFGRMLRLLIPSAAKNTEEFKKLGIRVFDAAGNLNAMADIAEDMERAFSTMSVAERSAALESLGFAKRMQASIFPILGASKNIRKFKEQLDDANGTMNEVAEKQLESVISQLKIFGSNILETVTQMFGFQEGAKGLVGVLKQMNELFQTRGMEWANTFRIMAIEATFAWKKITFVVSSAFSNIGTMFKWFVDNIDNIGIHIVDLWKGVFKDIKNLAVNFFTGYVKIFFNVGKVLFTFLKDGFSAIWNFIREGFDTKAFTGVFDGAKEKMRELGEVAKDSFVGTFKDIGKETEKAMEKAGIEPIKFLGFGDLANGLESINKEKIAAIGEFARREIGGIQELAKGAVGGGAGGVGTGESVASAARKLETSTIKAVEAGTVEALRLQHQRVSKEDQIAKNTKQTAVSTGQVVKKLDKLIGAVGGAGLEVKDVFA